MKNNVAMVDLLLRKGANASCAGYDKETALHHAVFQGNSRIAKLLVTHGANVDAKSQIGLTPLHFAVLRGHESLAEYLLAQGADGRQNLPNSRQTLAPIAAARGWVNV